MPKARVDLISAGVRQLLNDPGVTADLERRMAAVESAAKASAPVASGAYRDSIHTQTVRHGDRTVVQAIADVDYAMGVEANTGNLARALDAAGGS